MTHLWSCDSVWDGKDFTPCFWSRLNYLPFFLITISATYITFFSIRNYILSRKPSPSLSPDTLISPQADVNLSRLEANVILSALASNLLPLQQDATSEKPIPVEEAQAIIEEFRSIESPDAKRWEKVGRIIGIAGGSIYLAVQLASSIITNRWLDIAFPMWICLLALLPSAPITPLITLHLVPALLLLRHHVITGGVGAIEFVPIVVELLYWLVLISIPYTPKLDRLLAGGRTKGGGSSGSYGAKLPRHLEEPTSAFSKASYMFMLPFLFKHYFKTVALSDIPAMREDDSTSACLGAWRAFQASRDHSHEKKHGNKRKRNLALDLVIFFNPETRTQMAWSILFVFLQYLPPTGLRLLLRYVKERTSESDPYVPYLYVAMMAAGQCLGVVAIGQCLYIGRRLCIRLRSVIIAEVFTKALRRRGVVDVTKKTEIGKDGLPVPDSAAGATDGKIANLVSVDAFQISEICAYGFYMASAPTGVILNCILLYNTLGLASVAGIAVLVALIPLQALIGRLTTIVQRRLMSSTDARLQAVTEVIAHIKLIKFNAWEEKFYDRMSITRTKELQVLSQKFGILVLTSIVVWGTPVLVTACAFAVHSLILKQPLTADRAFSSLILFNMMRDPLALFQDTLTRLLQASTSCGRIQEFLEEPETLKYSQVTHPGPDDPQIGFRGAVVGYTTLQDSNNPIDTHEHEPFFLGELDISFPPGQLSLVVGPVGSGKTTLLASLLGETTLVKGQIFMPDDHANREACPVDPLTGLSDTVAFCDQTAWLIGASIKDNITFGSPWDAERYATVVDACALKRDFEIFDLGDETEVGEKGTTCSGGQKARIALARALYSSARTILLDDVLSAVDAQTGRHLFTHCLQGPLVQGRTIILVTHAVSLVAPAASFVVILDSGSVMASGPPSQLISSGLLDCPEDDVSSGSGSTTLSPIESTASDSPTSDRTKVDIIEENLNDIPTDNLEQAKQVDKDQAVPGISKQLVATESQGEGMVSYKTYKMYFTAMGGIPFWVILIAAFGLSQVTQVGSTAWIRDWANAYDSRAEILSWVTSRSTGFYLVVYVAISGLYLTFVATRVGIAMLGSLTASKRLYRRLLRRILGAKMRFFDSTPSGRIMNRLSKDMSSIDIEATEIMVYFANTVLSCAAIIIVIVLSTPAFLFAMTVITIMYWIVGALYVATSREIKRMDSVTRSPLFISFSEGLVGMATIRSYGDSARFMRKIFQELDQNLRCFWYLWQANRVLNNFSNFVGSLVTVFACVFALNNPSMNAGAVGFSITYALSFTEYVLWVVRLYAASEMSMNSVERVGEYLELEAEEDQNQKGEEPPAYWPSRDGSVVVENLTCRYAPQLDPVLRDVSFTIGPREKIGICGRTGSGKSTLALSFFRFLHQERGRIVIDGIDIAKLSLTTLRSRLTILPQEAQLFSGSIRDNLDPFGQHEDNEIWDALRQCGLAGKTPFVSRAPSRSGSRLNLSKLSTPTRGHPNAERSLGEREETEGSEDGSEVGEKVTIRSLEEKVAVGGKNFSQGQRQLLALARGLLKLRSSSFLVMDESTANLDHRTDQTIQNVLRTGLADIQMLVIAHRLMTVCGLDKILVLDHGQVVEFGTPYDLMQRDGPFRDLCRQSGEEGQLLELATRVHEAKGDM
ncbi:ATP-binding cassette transporter [Tremella mesenterica]|uniref:ATP-binding cassette transporter n=1 Tax=Tremella mesenterica TaxID=5217 RepID=A0A4Q1BW36_TREME|nr:ATP-binding cassette transporter [Tremella mesenterica]